MSDDIEEMFKSGTRDCELMICGTLYVIDFRANLQYAKADKRKTRRIKRDVAASLSKGVAGIR